jgi:prepilin-type N-terminal cleavage/methylation domain-containing protein
MTTRILSDNRGFTLIEMTIAVLIASMIIGILVGILKPFIVQSKMLQTQYNFEDIEAALRGFLLDNGHLPCPAPMTAAPGTINFASATDCTVGPVAGVNTATGRGGRNIRIGSVPAYSLDLNVDVMRDGWGNNFTYAVTEAAAMPFMFANDEGAISINDAAGNSMTSTAGNVLYVLVSHGEDEKGAIAANGMPTAFLCGADVDSENCDDDDVFVSAQRSMGANYYDDIIRYRAFIGDLIPPICGNKGMLYAPLHPEADAESCLDPSYRREGQASLAGNFDVPCITSGAFCDDAWTDITSLPAGDYLIHWNAFMRFDFAQPSQFAVVEFEADGVTESSETIPFTGTVCQALGNPQKESGIFSMSVANTSDLRFRMRYFGGQNNPGANGCPGNTPRLNMVESGTGAVTSLRTITVDPFRKPRTF